MARKSKVAPFKLKYTNGKKASPSAFFQMDQNMAPAPNPAVDQAINNKVEKKITEKVDTAMSKPAGNSPALNILDKVLGEKGDGKRLKKVGKALGKAAKIAATSFTHGLDAVYGTGKIKPESITFSDKKDKKDNKTSMGLIDENELEPADTKYDPNKK